MTDAELEVSPPTLATLEWTLHAKALEMRGEAVEKMQALGEDPPKPNERLRAAAKRRRK